MKDDAQTSLRPLDPLEWSTNGFSKPKRSLVTNATPPWQISSSFLSGCCILFAVGFSRTMFARVKSKRRRSPRDHSGLGGLAAYVLTPSPTKQSQVGIEPLPSAEVRQYQKGIEPFSPAKPTRNGADELFSRTTSSSMTTAESTSSTIQPARIQKTGDKSSYWLSDHDNFYIDRNAARKAYRVVSYKTTKTGKRKVFDILDGKTYHCGTGVQRRITDNAIVFASRSEALSERFPHNQHDASKSGNGRYARMLVSFGKCTAHTPFEH